MKQRSLRRIFICNILTLGLYEVYWLSETRKEMITLSGSRIPSVSRFVLFRLIMIAAFLFALWGVHLMSTPRPIRDKPDATCYGQYTQDPACKKEIDNYYAPDNQLLGVKLFFASLIVLAVVSWLTLKWLVPYCEAIERVTDGRNATNNALFLLLMYSFGFGMLAIQRRFNQFPDIQ